MAKFGERTVVGSVAESFAVLVCPPPETEAELVMLLVPIGVFVPTLTAKLKILVPLAVIAVELVQVIVCGFVAFELQVQFAPLVPPAVTLPEPPPLTVNPVGKVSVTVIAPLEAVPPALVTVNE